MGLFRSRAKKVREKAAAELPREQPTATVEAVVAHKETTAVAAVVAHKETTAEERPDPDRPGWGRTLGQQIGKTREGHAGQV